MRVIAGSARGRRLVSIRGDKTRPTADKLRETLFNIIAPRVFESSFLDVFSGTGAIGIEALSRGAETAVFVEKNGQALSVIKQNIEMLNFGDKANVMPYDFSTALNMLGQQGKKFDIIFLDPPYYKKFEAEALKQIVLNDLLLNDGIIIVEQGSKDEIPCVDGLRAYDVRKYSTSTLLFYTASEE